MAPTRMRTTFLCLALIGCGDVRIGDDVRPLTAGDAGSCPGDLAALATGPLCLHNSSFEGTPGFNFGVPTMFDALPWSVCTNPSVSNTPEIGSGLVDPAVAPSIPRATQGLTWLGLSEDEQVSQTLCRGVPGGTSLSFRIDLSRIDFGANVVPASEVAFLEVWGGIAADCSRRQLLWASPGLETAWNTYCATVRTPEYFDSLVLVSRSDKSQPGPTYVVADHIVPVERCDDHCPP